MTNEQVIILLMGFKAQLQSAVNLVEANLPEDLMIKAKSLPFLKTEDIVLYPVLDPLYDMLEVLDESIEVLRKVNESNG